MGVMERNRGEGKGMVGSRERWRIEEERVIEIVNGCEWRIEGW
jgi:hypothetical protein